MYIRIFVNNSIPLKFTHTNDKREKTISRIRISFHKPIRGVAPGQIAAIYIGGVEVERNDDDKNDIVPEKAFNHTGLICLGGGAISEPGQTYHERNTSLPPKHLLHPSGNNDISLLT